MIPTGNERVSDRRLEHARAYRLAADTQATAFHFLGFLHNVDVHGIRGKGLTEQVSITYNAHPYEYFRNVLWREKKGCNERMQRALGM